jgi:hypothetical protein
MKFGYACTFAGKPRCETPAPPFKKRTPVFPRLPACRALSRQIGKCIFRPMLAVFRTGRRHQFAFGEHVLGPGLPHLAAQQKRYNRRLPYPPPSHKACLEDIYWAAPIARCAPACLRAPDWAVSPHRACFCLLGGFRNWFGYLERRDSTRREHAYLPGRRGAQNTGAFVSNAKNAGGEERKMLLHCIKAK